MHVFVDTVENISKKISRKRTMKCICSVTLDPLTVHCYSVQLWKPATAAATALERPVCNQRTQCCVIICIRTGTTSVCPHGCRSACGCQSCLCWQVVIVTVLANLVLVHVSIQYEIVAWSLGSGEVSLSWIYHV